MYKTIFLLTSLLLTVQNPNSRPHKFSEISQVNILDLVNNNYEHIESKSYHIVYSNKENSFILYDTQEITPSEFYRTRLKKFFRRYDKKQNEKDTKFDSFEDKFNDRIQEKYLKFISTRKHKQLYEINEVTINELNKILDEENRNFSHLFKKNYVISNPNLEEIDSLFIRQKFESLKMTSYYPTLQMEIINNSNDTTVYYTSSQNNPPMPWIKIQNGQKDTIYDERINKFLLKVLPDNPKLNKVRLYSDLDSLFNVFSNE